MNEEKSSIINFSAGDFIERKVSVKQQQLGSMVYISKPNSIRGSTVYVNNFNDDINNQSMF